MSDLKQKIVPNLWFDREAEDAARFYSSVFQNSSVGRINRAGKAGFEIHHIPEGTAMTVEFEIEGYQFVGINGGPLFKINPSVSFFVYCSTKWEVEALWKKLNAGGSALMELGEYPFSEKYGWTQDRYGLSWQVIFVGDRNIEHKIIPALMFVGDQSGKAEAAMDFYTSVFRNSRVGNIFRYAKGQEPDKEGTVAHGVFILEGQDFIAMDSARPHNFAFNESISLMVECRDQQEIDYFWDKLISGGGQESMCGWLKDRFGFSWQVTPVLLGEMLRDSDTKKVERVTNAFLKMKKFDIAALKKAFEG